MTDNTTAADTAKPAAAAPSRGFHPDRVTPRPAPAPKPASAPVTNSLKKSGLSSVRKKSAPMDEAARRQRKMTILVGLLSVVFVGVIIVSFGGIGQSNKVQSADKEETSAVPVTRIDPESWVFPEPLPEQMRNPLVIPKAQVVLADPDPAAETSDLRVQGIVHSETLPSAIIGGQVVLEGQTIFGATITKISRDSVEFEKDGKHWTQHVE